MSDQRPQLLGRRQLALLGLAAAASFTAGACFNGFEADGLPCETDAQCGAQTQCIDGFCGGLFFCEDLSDIDPGQVCDGELDCPEGEDEDPELCAALNGDGDGDGGETFECADGNTIPAEQLCDGEANCPDESDEAGFCGGLGLNQCSADTADLAYELGPAEAGVQNPLEVEVIDFLGTNSPDAIYAGSGDTDLYIAFDLEQDASKRFALSDVVPFAGREVIDYELGRADADMSEDLVIATAGETIAFHVVRNNRPNMPTLYGAPIELPQVIEVLEPQLRAIELGQLDSNSPIDMVAIIDTGDNARGRLLVGFGDSAAAEADPAGTYFSLAELPTTSVGYDEFYDSELVDFDGNGLLDLLVLGSAGGMGRMWVIPRDGQQLGSWGEPGTSFAPVGEMAMGRFANAPEPGAPIGPTPDLVFLDPVLGQLVPVRNEGGTPMPRTEIDIEGAMPSGLVVADFNCDGNGDFAYNVANPPEIHLLFGDGDGGVLSETPLVYASDGTPRGGLGVGTLAGGPAPDIFSAVDMGPNLDMPQLRVLLDQQ